MNIGTSFIESNRLRFMMKNSKLVCRYRLEAFVVPVVNICWCYYCCFPMLYTSMTIVMSMEFAFLCCNSDILL